MKYTNKFNVPQSLVDVVEKKTYDLTQSDPMRIGVTTLNAPPRQRMLKVRHWKDLIEDVADHIWRITGSAYHYILASTKGKDRLIEKKLEQEVDGMLIVGRLDLFEEKDNSIEDWKVTSVWSVTLGDKKDWEEQINVYAWMLRKEGYNVEKGFINAILRDWNKGNSKKYNDYPPIPFKRIEVKIWSFEEQEKFIKERVRIHKEALELSDEDLPICTEVERWKKPSKWAVYKGKNKTATRLFDGEAEAKKFIETAKIEKARIECRKGVDSRCVDFCSVNKKCSYYMANYEKEKNSNN